jgi:hypothetical protein
VMAMVQTNDSAQKKTCYLLIKYMSTNPCKQRGVVNKIVIDVKTR